MAFTPSEQELYDFAKNAVPRFLFADDGRSEEEINAFVKVFDQARTQILAFFDQSRILAATGGVTDWLNQHAIDRGTQRRDGETDAALRARLRTFEDALTRPTLLQAAQDIVDAAALGGSPVVAMVELPRDKAFLTDFIGNVASDGGVFSGTPPDMEFLPNTPFTDIPFRQIEEEINYKMIFTSCSSAGNDGLFAVTGLNGNAVQFQNASGVAETDGGANWAALRYDRDDNILTPRQDSYLSRGDRLGSVGGPPRIIIIIPRGTGPFSDASLQASVLEAMRQKKGAGVIAAVERRLT